MDVLPLADGPPPRYAVESDDEDEYNPLPQSRSRPNQPPDSVDVEFRSIYDIPSERPLVFASGKAGLGWAKTTHLGEQRAGIYVNHLPVGLLFLPTWTSAVVVVSEIELRTQLPLYAMTTYTTAIIARLQPTSVAILDAYPTQAYISPRAISQDTPPVRYLSAGEKPIPDPELELFAPPNLLQSTTASLLNELFLHSVGEESTPPARAIILLPSFKVSPPPPTLDGKGGAAGVIEDSNWGEETVKKAHRWLFAIVGEEGDGSSSRLHTKSGVKISARSTRLGLGEIGEGGMYI